MKYDCRLTSPLLLDPEELHFTLKEAGNLGQYLNLQDPYQIGEDEKCHHPLHHHQVWLCLPHLLPQYQTSSKQFPEGAHCCRSRRQQHRKNLQLWFSVATTETITILTQTISVEYSCSFVFHFGNHFLSQYQ